MLQGLWFMVWYQIGVGGGGFLQPQVEPLGRRIPRFMIQFSYFSGVRCGFADGAAHPLIPDSWISFVFFISKRRGKNILHQHFLTLVILDMDRSILRIDVHRYVKRKQLPN